LLHCLSSASPVVGISMDFTEEEIQLMKSSILSTLKGDCSHELFRMQFRPEVVDKHGLTLELLRKARDQNNAANVYPALFLGFVFGFVADHVPVLCDLLKADWHFQHEDIVSAIDTLRDERAVPTLYEAALANHEYLDYDEFYALARKAVWALADIGTESAIEKLRLLDDGDNPVKAAYAIEQLGYLEKGLKPERMMP
jgi:PBS lyase HEAT-like repeat